MEIRRQKNEPLFPEILWERPVHYYKAQGGKVFVLAGSSGMSGAAILTCEAVFRSGTGILILGFPKKISQFYSEVFPEAMTLALPSTHGGSIAASAKSQIIEESKASSLVIIGPGLSQNSETIQLIWELLFEIEKPIVLDADGLNALSFGISVMRKKENEEYLIDYFKKLKTSLVLTPHPGEAEKILTAANFSGISQKITSKYIERHKNDVAKLISEKLGVYTVLKGHNTVICEPNGRMVENYSGGPELATAGSGDVLSGIVGSFIAQNPKKIFEAATTAVFLHSQAGKIAKEKVGKRSVMATDIIKYLPDAIKSVEKN